MSKRFKRAGLATRSATQAAALKPKAKVSRRPVQEMYRHYQEGATMGEVAKKFGISLTYVSQLFKKAGLKARTPVPGLNVYPVQEMYRAYRAGVSLDEVGDRFGVPASTVSQLFGRAGFKPFRREQHPPSKLKTGASASHVQDMYVLYEQGATLQEIGYRFGVTREYVRQLFKAAGLKTRPRGTRSRSRSQG